MSALSSNSDVRKRNGAKNIFDLFLQHENGNRCALAGPEQQLIPLTPSLELSIMKHSHLINPQLGHKSHNSSGDAGFSRLFQPSSASIRVGFVWGWVGGGGVSVLTHDRF